MSTLIDKPSVVWVGAKGDLDARLTAALKDTARILGTLPPEPSAALDRFRALAPSVVIVAATLDVDVLGELIGELAGAGAYVIIVGPKKDPDLILATVRAGAREFVVDGDLDDLKRAVRAHARPRRASAGKIVTIFPAKGGVGATAIATNLAGAFQRAGHRVCLLDLDLHLGDVLSFLDLGAGYSISDVLANMKRLDAELLDTSLARHASGVRVLAQSGKIEEAEHVKGADITNVIEFLQRHYDRIVIDGARGFHEVSLAALDASQHVLLVLTQDVPAVRNAQRCLDLFRRLGYEGDRVQLVLNRFQKASKITADVIADALGAAPAAELANDFPAVVGAINRGQLLVDAAPRSKLTKDIDDLVPLLGGGKQQRVRSKSGFFGALLGRNGNGSQGTSDAD